MKLTIFGATGRMGQNLLQKALEAGHQVTVLVRDPTKVTRTSDRLRVVLGSLDDPAGLDAVIAGADVILSALGPSHNRPTYDISRGMQAILDSMKKNGVRRLIISAGAGVGDPGDSPKLFNKLINVLLKVTARNVYEDMLKTVELVRASGLDWTVVRVPMLTDDPLVGQVKVGMVGSGMGPRITRADLAAFLLEQVESREYIGKAPAISN
jgi:putative NADH-flavin reductase